MHKKLIDIFKRRPGLKGNFGANTNGEQVGDIESSVSTLNWFTGSVSTILSTVAFAILKFYHFLEAYSSMIIFVSATLSLICLLLAAKRKKFWPFFVLFFVLLVLSGTLDKRKSVYEDKVSEQAFLAEATDCCADIFSEKMWPTVQETAPWFLQAAKDNQILYILIPSSLDPTAVGQNAFDPEKIRLDSPILQMRLISPEYTVFGKKVARDFIIAGLYKPHLKDSYSFKRCKVLDESVEMTMCGLASMMSLDFPRAKSMFEKADSLGNATATLQLSRLYARGISVTESFEKAMQLQERAASLGNRSAKVSWCKGILVDSTSSSLERAKAEDGLLWASRVRSLFSNHILKLSRAAIEQLCEYYWTTGRFEDAYGFTRARMQGFEDPAILYPYHLYNCLYTGRLDEAKEIIAKGESEGHPGAFAAHAEMLRRGSGYDIDLLEAERLLKHASELHPDPSNPTEATSSSIYLALEKVYIEAADSAGAHFWRRLAQINFKGGVDDE